MSDATAAAAPETSTPLLRWPPPGLARVQGDLWVVQSKMVIAAAVLVLPILLVISVPQTDTGLGPLGDGWWIVLVSTLAGLALFADASVALVRMLLRVKRAFAEGYSGHVIGLVVSDRRRDHGYVLQGAQAFSTLTPRQRRSLSDLRLWVPVFYLFASLWVPVAFSALVLLAARGVVTPSGLVLGTLGPAGLLGAVGLVLSAFEGTLARKARTAWFRQPWSQDLERQEVEDWATEGAARGFVLEDIRVRSGWVRPTVVASIVLSVLVVVPPVTLAPVSSMGAILVSVTGFSFSTTQRRAAEAEALRFLRAAPDDLEPVEAGDLLNTLAFVGRDDPPVEGLRPPSQVIEERWFPQERPAGWDAAGTFRADLPPIWTDSLWARVDRGLSADERAYLREVASHPGHALFSRLARASSVDVVSGRYVLPLDPRLTYYELPIPRMSGLRPAALSHIAVAALQSSEGRHAEAEATIREVATVGFLLLDDGPGLVDNLIGAVMVQYAATAMAHAWDRAGNGEGVARIEASKDVAEVIARRAEASTGSWTANSALERMRQVSLNESAVRGLRWEYAHLAATVTPCLNIRTIVFGPGDGYEQWLARVEAGLVRTDAEAQLFDVAARGLVIEDRGSTVLGTLLTMTMGSSGSGASCAKVVTTLSGFM